MICVDSVTVNPKRIELKKGQWYSGATAVVSPQDATCCKVTWSSSNTDVATVNASSGRIYANKAGTAKIYATATDGSGKSDYIYVIVKVPVDAITVEPAEKTLTVGGTMYARAVISPASASDRTVCWSSKNPNVATVIPHTGLVMAQSPGTTQIYATAKDGSGVCGFMNVTVEYNFPYPDNLIDHSETRARLGFLMTLIDENEEAYRSGKICLDTKKFIEDQFKAECDIIRADYIATGKNPFSNYAYEMLGGDPNAQPLYPLAQDLTLGSTGLAVIVVQRTLEVLGHYEMPAGGAYGTFDEETYEAARACRLLLEKNDDGEYIFNVDSYYALLQAHNISQRTYEAFNQINQYRIVHDTVAMWCAAKVGGTFERSENIIRKGSPSFIRNGYADILQKHNTHTYIWEVKPNAELYYGEGGIGALQLQRYYYAGNAFVQDHFQQPLQYGYYLGEFSIEFFDDIINVESYISPSGIGDARNALVLYKFREEGDPVYELETVAVPVPDASRNYYFSMEKNINTVVGGSIAVIGVAIVAGAAMLMVEAAGGVAGMVSYVGGKAIQLLPTVAAAGSTIPVPAS